VRLARFGVDGVVRLGLIKDGVVYEIEGYPEPGSSEVTRAGGEWPLDTVDLLAPVTPSKVVAIGLNYKAHAEEFGKELPVEPMLFLKPPSSVIGPGSDILYPAHMSHRVDYEAELGVVIGARAVGVAPDKSAEYILGYTCFNDVTARDLQGRDVQYTRAKGFDTFGPVGPWIETDLDPESVRVEAYLNGEKRQDSSTRDMIFNVYELVSFVSRVMTLLPGDIIATGTPPGVGKMAPGDEVEIRLSGIGSLKNRVELGPIT
jgi:2-keto-4-pentenoate hydratase/2-oxohepta-3-ene-1,7-dioic acid hydratase in catechol pathway